MYKTYDDEWLTATGWWATATGWATTGVAWITGAEWTRTPGAGAANTTLKMHDTTN